MVIMMKKFEFPKLSEDTKKVLLSVLISAILVLSMIGLLIGAIYLLTYHTLALIIIIVGIIIIACIIYVAYKIYEEFF